MLVCAADPWPKKISTRKNEKRLVYLNGIAFYFGIIIYKQHRKGVCLRREMTVTI